MSDKEPDLSGTSEDGEDVTSISGKEPIVRDPSSSDGITFDFQAKLYTQRYTQRSWLFTIAVIAALCMIFAFISFVICVVCWVWKFPDKKLDWHALLLGSALIIPPTLIVGMLMKHVFRSDGKLENGKGDDGGSGILVKDFVEQIIDIIKKIAGSKN